MSYLALAITAAIALWFLLSRRQARAQQEDEEPIVSGGSCAQLEAQGIPEGQGVFFIPNLYVWMLQHEDEVADAPSFARVRGMCPAILMGLPDIRAMEAERDDMPNDFTFEDWQQWQTE
ncbi:hypothetical protein ACFQ14_16940 [Pseudahrensia aquimaris]|uniref:Uncharacterized protein n=1 Tax=Pseudahrensia aquimaris TaxID=744461 RepID=A0ABW3FHW9_9HYPH